MVPKYISYKVITLKDKNQSILLKITLPPYTVFQVLLEDSERHF